MPGLNQNTSDRPTRPSRRQRRGFLTFEMMLVLPVLLVVILAVVEFSMLLLSSQAVAGAASVASRQATLPGADAADVQAAATQALAGWKFAGDVTTQITVNGIPESSSPLSLAATGDVIAVTVEVPSLSAVPDVLRYIGITLAGKTITTTYVAPRE